MYRRLAIMAVLFHFYAASVSAQSCQDFIDFVKSEDRGTTYNSYNSEAISRVTFYDIRIDYQRYYFAIVCFKNKYTYNCTEYIYQVASNTRVNYSIYYLSSAGEAFWNYIQPYSNVLGCGPNFD